MDPAICAALVCAVAVPFWVAPLVAAKLLVRGEICFTKQRLVALVDKRASRVVAPLCYE